MCGKGLNFLPNDKILDWSKLKTYANDNLKVIEMTIYVLDTVEIILRKCWLPAFSPFPPDDCKSRLVQGC